MWVGQTSRNYFLCISNIMSYSFFVFIYRYCNSCRLKTDQVIYKIFLLLFNCYLILVFRVYFFLWAFFFFFKCWLFMHVHYFFLFIILYIYPSVHFLLILFLIKLSFRIVALWHLYPFILYMGLISDSFITSS